MNVEEAKLVLELYRPRPGAPIDDRVAEALEILREHPELLDWYREQQALDAEIRSQLNAIPVPGGLRQQLLQQRPVHRAWHRVYQPALAAAACVAMLAVASFLWWQARPVEFASLRQHIIDRSWGTSPHLAIRTGNLQEAKDWLRAQNVPSDFEIPPALIAAKLSGCSIVTWRGYAVPVLCLHEGNRHLHLYVVDSLELADVPNGDIPVLVDHGPINTASWSQADKAYVLTGFNTKSFVKKFRKDGRWNLNG